MVQFHEMHSGAVWLAELEPILELESSVQNIRYLRSSDYGRVLIINGELQHVEAWAPFYHELVVHIPSAFIRKPKRALVLGGGSLFAAQELLKYDSVEIIDLVDHDSKVLQATVDAYPERSHAFRDRRLQFIEQRCETYLAECKENYDIIINDCFDLYEVDKNSDSDLYFDLDRILSCHGVVSDVVYRSIYHENSARNALGRIPRHLRKVASLLAIPEYPGVLHLLTMWGKNKNLRQDLSIVENELQISMFSNGNFEIFTPKCIGFYLYLPPYIYKFIQ